MLLCFQICIDPWGVESWALYDTGPTHRYYYGYSIKYLITSVSLCSCRSYVHSKQYVSILVFTSSCWTKVETVWRCREAIEHTLKLFLCTVYSFQPLSDLIIHSYSCKRQHISSVGVIMYFLHLYPWYVLKKVPVALGFYHGVVQAFTLLGYLPVFQNSLLVPSSSVNYYQPLLCYNTEEQWPQVPVALFLVLEFGVI